ncbi:ABC transporter permease subunit [Aquisalimonas sp.]|uniref:ABC transporter permease n=1 Tax=Aquisalimonas sp. TaxID=1872621 RepID=UPI0025BC0381|nr:ABC transporter permease subunit [Aquisalimonas sp.]
MMILKLAGRELRLLFRSPLPWILLAVSQAVTAWWFLSLVEQFQAVYQPMLVRTNSPMGVTDLVLMPFFGSVVVLGMLLLAAALLAMRLIADERRSGAIVMLFAAPLTITELVLGKYLAALGFLMVLMATWCVMPAALLIGTELDLGRLAAAALALTLLALAFASVALFASTLTLQPGVAVVLTAGIVLALLGLDAAVDSDDPLTRYVALLPHYESLVQGRVASEDIVYFVLLTVGFLGFTIQRLDGLRLRAG